jgi:hypothetical protein
MRRSSGSRKRRAAASEFPERKATLVLAPTTAAGGGFNIQQIDARRVALNRAAARPPVRVLSSNRANGVLVHNQSLCPHRATLMDESPVFTPGRPLPRPLSSALPRPAHWRYAGRRFRTRAAPCDQIVHTGFCSSHSSRYWSPPCSGKRCGLWTRRGPLIP